MAVSILAVAAAASGSSWANESSTHRLMSMNAVQQSLLFNAAMFQRLGLVGAYNGAGGLLAQNSANNCYPHDPFQVTPIEWQLGYDGSSLLLKYPSVRKVRGVARLQ